MKKLDNYYFGIKFISVLVFIGTWQFLSSNNINLFLNFGNLPTPLNVFEKLLIVFKDAEIYSWIFISIIRVYSGILIALMIGIPLGLACGIDRKIENLFFPIIEILRPIPNIAWAPISIILFPTVNQSIVFITFIGAFFPILLNTIAGVRSLPKKYSEVIVTFNLNRLEAFRHIIVPHTLPYIFSGLTIGSGVSWLGVIVAEMISGQSGIGYYTWLGYQLVDYSQIVIGIICIGCLGVLSSSFISLLEELTIKWRKKTNAY